LTQPEVTRKKKMYIPSHVSRCYWFKSSERHSEGQPRKKERERKIKQENRKNILLAADHLLLIFRVMSCVQPRVNDQK